MNGMSGSDKLEKVVRHARRRSLWNLMVSQAATAACTGLAGVLVLLLVGTQILDWRWLLFLVGGSFTLGFYRTFRRLPSSYAVAEQVDRSLDLHDTLSTAFFFGQRGDNRASEGMVEAQQRHAERVCRELDVKQALPLVTPRALSTVVMLGVAALGMFALRYGLTRSLDLRLPIVRAAGFDVFKVLFRTQAASAKNRTGKSPQGLLTEDGLPLAQRDLRSATGLPPDLAANVGEVADSTNMQAKARSGQADPHAPSEEGEGAPGSSDEPGDAMSSSGSPADKEPDAASRKQASAENSSLMEKLKDAMADLLSKLKIQPHFGESRQAEANTQSGLRAGSQKRAPGEKGQPGSEQQQGESGGSGDQQADREGEGNSQGASGKSGEKGASQRASGQENSGAGKEEGSKDVKEAQQLAAMGKISEIIGKRSASLTGEVTVEVSSGKQQDLKTPYSQTSAAHAEAGGEIHRDEVPLIFQNYVQQYFEQVRKMPAPAGEKTPQRPATR
jgi:hypothetical protein